MADSKVTDLTAATSVNPADVLYMVQSNADRKISMSTLLANLPTTLIQFGGLLALDVESPQVIANAGTINATSLFTLISNTGGVNALSIVDGTYTGQVKFIMCTSAGGTSSITSNIKGVTSAVFTEMGQTLVLLWYNSDWWVIGGSAAVNF